MKKFLEKRLDEQMILLGLCESRSKAQNLILAKSVRVNGQTETQKSVLVSENDIIEIDENIKYVSRGGFKLEHAIKEFSLDINGKVCLDIGASTGGFTDCLLQCGAEKVYALDVGQNQLSYKIRKDRRVVVMEKINIKDVTSEMFIPLPLLIVTDVSFISITKFAHVIKNIFPNIEAWVSLIKPQFEAERGEVGKGGIVRDDEKRHEIFQRCVSAVESEGFFAEKTCLSPIKGGKGNIEYLALFRNNRKIDTV